MKTNGIGVGIAGLCALSIGFATPTRAGLTQFSINYYTDYGGNISYFNGSTEVTDQGVLATAFTATRIGGDVLPAGTGNPFTTFCIDIRYFLSNPAYWQSGPFPNPNTGSGSAPFWQPNGIYRAASLYNAYAGGVGVDLANNNAINHLEGAALQLAIWDALYGSSGTFSVNNAADTGFHATGYDQTVVDRANAMLASSANQVDVSLQTTFWDATLDQNGLPLIENQDLIGPPMAAMVPIPERATYLGAIAGGILCFMAFHRSRRVDFAQS